MAKKAAPCGSWASPIGAEMVASAAVRLGSVAPDGGGIFWGESRPAEGGRTVVVERTPAGRLRDWNAAPFDARTRAHEYGGGAWLVADGVLYFSNDSDQRLYRQRRDSQPEALTRAEGYRYADSRLDAGRNRILCVREDHTGGGREPVNTLVEVPLARPSESGRVLVQGHDFFSSPRLSPDGSRLAWLAWDHPNMPWDGTTLWVASLDESGAPVESQLVAGGPAESIFQPEWGPDGELYFVSDRSGWWNLYRWPGDTVTALCSREAEFGQPQWVFGMSSYAVLSGGRILCSWTERGRWRLGRVDTGSGRLDTLDLPWTEISGLRASDSEAVFLAGSPSQPTSVVRLELATRRWEVLRRSASFDIADGYLSIPEGVEYPARDGQRAHAFYYPPASAGFEVPEGELPPLIVRSHGGPTSAASSALDPKYLFWTSRGFAILDVNYGGSTGYGRSYRERLRGQWGIVDVDDCVDGALFLAEAGRVDRNRLAIAGGSAGGYTTLCALTFRDAFRAGASSYGISDLETLARDTHKFESRYLDSLVGPWPERKELYQERSPIHFTDRLSCPVIFFQGREDRVVPPAQAEVMVEALRAKGLPVAYLAFDGEQHGFRRAENIRRALEAELYFYSRIFGFEPADALEPVSIDNLSG